MASYLLSDPRTSYLFLTRAVFALFAVMAVAFAAAAISIPLIGGLNEWWGYPNLAGTMFGFAASTLFLYFLWTRGGPGARSLSINRSEVTFVYDRLGTVALGWVGKGDLFEIIDFRPGIRTGKFPRTQWEGFVTPRGGTGTVIPGDAIEELIETARAAGARVESRLPRRGSADLVVHRIAGSES